MATNGDDVERTFVEEVGQRLRAIRRQQRLSLEEVEHRSGGRWSASAIGAYERGYRNLSLGRLRELADFYNVPISVLVGEIDLRPEQHSPATTSRVTLDIGALEHHPEAAPIARYAQSIAMERGDFNGRVLTLRRDDIRMLSSVFQVTEAELLERLTGWGVLHGDGDGIASGVMAEALEAAGAAEAERADGPPEPATRATVIDLTESRNQPVA